MMSSWCVLPLLLVLATCGGPKEPTVEKWQDSAWTPVTVETYSIDGKRDGRKTKAVASFGLQDGGQLQVEMEVSYNPQPILSAGHWTYTGETTLEGTVIERSMKFSGGQAEGPSLGGSFRLDHQGHPRFRVMLPVRPVSKPRWQ